MKTTLTKNNLVKNIYIKTVVGTVLLLYCDLSNGIDKQFYIERYLVGVVV